MEITEKRALLYEMIRRDIGYWISQTAEIVKGNRDLPRRGDIEAFMLLRERLTSEADVHALEQVMTRTCRGLLHSIFVMFDGGAELNEHFVPAIIDRDTKENLEPVNGTYHDSFIDYLSDHEDSPVG